MPTHEEKAAGMRIEPPVSLPMVAKPTPAASAAPEPLLENPGIRSRSQGLRAQP